MCQRVMIAMALSCQPKLLIADEPTTGVDVTIQAQVLDLFAKLAYEHGATALIITHDLGVVAETCDYTAVMYAGKVVEFGTSEDISKILCTRILRDWSSLRSPRMKATSCTTSRAPSRTCSICR